MEKGVAPPTISIGTTGTIGSLMSRELESMKITQKTAQRDKKNTPAPVSIFCGTTLKKEQIRKKTPSQNDSGSSSNSDMQCSNVECRGLNTSHRAVPSNQHKTEHRLPMLNSESDTVDKQGNRKAGDKKAPGVGCHIVEVVDVKCGSTDKFWSSPITSFKRLGFSKLSDV